MTTSGDGSSAGGLVVGVIAETAVRERRVALDPSAVERLVGSGVEVVVEEGAGALAWLPDSAFEAAGGRVVRPAEVIARSDVVVCVRAPGPDVVDRLRSGQVVIGLLGLLGDPGFADQLARLGVTAVSLEGLPRTLSRAQAMDALSSQASVAGYRSVLLAADLFGRYFPMMVTAAGTARPAEVLILGAGVAGLQAIGTARRLGAFVRAFDVRPDSRSEVESLGASFLDISSVPTAAGEGGYARALTSEEQTALAAEIAGHAARHDIVITTAQVPGRTPPVLLTAAAVEGMRAGSVVIDAASGELGGNVASSRAGETVVTPGGVTVVGADDLPSRMPTGASAVYARNIAATLGHLLDDGSVRIDLDDEIQAGIVMTHEGSVVHPGLSARTGSATGGA